MTELDAQYFECRTEEVVTSCDQANMPRIQTVMMVTNQPHEPSSSSPQRSSSPDGPKYVIAHDGDGGPTFVSDAQEMFVQHHNIDALLAYPVNTVYTLSSETVVDGSWADHNYSNDQQTYAQTTTAEPQEQLEQPHDTDSPAPSATRFVETHPATVEWLLEHYEAAEGVSLPRSALYAHYLKHCAHHDLEPVNAASFGKLIRAVFVGLRTRRLGTRGNSKYHYYGIKAKASSPLAASPADSGGPGDAEPRAGRAAGAEMPAPQHLQYLGEPTTPELPELKLTAPLTSGITVEDVDTFRMVYRDHCESFIDAVGALELAAIERLWREFWRCSDNEEEDHLLSRSVMFKLASRVDVATWMRQADVIVFQKAVEILLPDVLRPIPAALTHSVRNFAKALVGWARAGSRNAPVAARAARLSSASALAAALRRYTSLNHLAQAARAVLHNRGQIHQMLDDLNRVDFRNVREQAAWVCRCTGAAQLERDFKALLGRGALLEQWARWLNSAVSSALPIAPEHTYASRARRFLLDWSFYSSMVIRDLTLRSAASFGSFHLIRLLYDEYVFYLVEKMVAERMNRPPISILHQELYEELSIDKVDDSEERENNNGDYESAPESPEPQMKKPKMESENDEDSCGGDIK